jgi:hypothetical protein
LVERLQHVHGVRQNQISHQQLIFRLEESSGTHSHRRGISSEMPNHDVGIDEGRHFRLEARRARVVEITSSQAALRRVAGTATVPANERKSGVRAKTARLPSTRNTISSPCSIPSASRTAFGTVI